jgi:hypothetical protein
LLAIAGVLLLWHLLDSGSGSPTPVLAPPDSSHAAETDAPPVTNPFGEAASLPKELPAEAFSKMIAEFSEPDGSFMYKNYLSNERSYQEPIPSLVKAAKPGGVYLGVGPEQNFTYIAAIRPAMAFIVDIRRQNMLELLMYKVLFEAAANRSEFISLLFSRPAPSVATENSTALDLFQSYEPVQPDQKLFERNLKRIKDQLELSPDDEKSVEEIYRVFFSLGPDLSYSSADAYAPAGPSYASLMTLTDANGKNWSYLASEENFRFVKEMQRKNLVIPLVGDFSGYKTIRTVGRYVKDHRAMVSAFYVSNVEMYILASTQWKAFCANVASLPMDESSMFIRFLLGQYARTRSPYGFGTRNASVIGPMIDVRTGVTKGYPLSYPDLIQASR